MKKNLSYFYTIGILLAATILSVLFIDQPLAVFLDHHGKMLKPLFSKAVEGIEVVSGFTFSQFLLGGILLTLGIALWIKDKNRSRANVFLLIGLAHTCSLLLAGTLKNVFHRSRPSGYLANHAVSDFCTATGDAFPSGHAAHFFSLFIPLMLLFPKYKWSLLVVPVFIAVQRVLSGDHYLGDVLAGTLIACLFSIVFMIAIKPVEHEKD